MYIVYALVGISLILWDISKKNVYKLIFASSFLFCAVIAYKFPNNYIYQSTGFIIFGIISCITIKKILKNETVELRKRNNLNNSEGKIVTVVKDIGKTLSIDGFGFVEYKGELYQAKSTDDSEIKAGQKVKIISRENIILNVEAVKIDTKNK